MLLILRVVIAVLVTTFATQPAVAVPMSDPVECWLENQTPTVQIGAWAQYVVHLSGGLGTYSVTLSYGDGQQDQGTYAANSANFSHAFQATGLFNQSAVVIGAGSQGSCGSSTNVF